jgi:FAD/FMN-containing dehydrogenase
VKLSGWGRYPRIDCPVVRMRETEEAPRIIGARSSVIPFGNGRSYGDAALNRDGVVATRCADRFIDMDAATGIVTVEAGLLLAELIRIVLPRGWFPAVTPGTKFITIGGAIAADVHGKNHHTVGTFSQHVEWLDLLTADGSVRRCSRTADTELFDATCGGMGLTGLILRAALRLIPVESAFMQQETLQAADLETAMSLLEASETWPYTVAWIDCVTGGAQLGRSLIYRADHAKRGDAGTNPFAAPTRRALAVPVDFPSFALNPLTVQAFNALYYRRGRPGLALVDYDRYFYPLDSITGWNRIYGRRGFVQYQCVIPRAASQEALHRLLEEMVRAKSGSFLAVLKLFGAEAQGYLSFPMEGYTLALDFPANAANLALLERLDRILLDFGGRIYLAKDARQSAEMVRRGYPKLDRFKSVRAQIDPNRKFNSLLAERLDL